ncbi:MAG: hypothetical protein WCX29_00455 [Candidatus Peribacteraceae bacterium]
MPIDVPPQAPRAPEVPERNRERIAELAQQNERLEELYKPLFERMKLGADIAAENAGNPQNAIMSRIDENYSQLMQNRVETYLLSGTPEALRQQYQQVNRNRETAFMGERDREAIQDALGLFFKTEKGHDPLLQYYPSVTGDGNVAHVQTEVLYRHMQTLQSITPTHPSQHAFLEQCTEALQTIIAMDPIAQSVLEATVKREEQQSKSPMNTFKKTGRLALVLLGVGGAIVSLVANRGKPSLPLAMYAGIAYLGYNGGLPKGSHKRQKDQLAFLPRQQREQVDQIVPLVQQPFETLARTYGISGREWVRITGRLMAPDGRQRMRRLERELKNKNTEQTPQELHEAFAESIAPRPAENAHIAFRNMKPEDRMHFCRIVQGVTDAEAQRILLQFIENDMGNHLWKEL